MEDIQTLNGAHQQRQACGRRSLPGRPTRFAHVIDDEEEDGEEVEVADKESEQPHANSPVADSDEEEEGIVDEYGLHAVDRRHLNEDQWEDAVISRARHEADDVLLLRIHWPDGHSAWVNRYALHVRPHCHLKLIDFYESKAKPKH
ncbi:g1837 [Coccomyxa elongata]